MIEFSYPTGSRAPGMSSASAEPQSTRPAPAPARSIAGQAVVMGSPWSSRSIAPSVTAVGGKLHQARLSAGASTSPAGRREG